MFSIQGEPCNRLCDGLPRRNFLKIGSLGLGGLSMSGLLRAESMNSVGSSNKSVIMVYLPGGPQHQDMVDLKMDAPAEIRGEFRPIATNVADVTGRPHYLVDDGYQPIKELV